MPSSPTAAARDDHAAHLGALLTLLQAVPDPRARRGVRYPLAGLLAVGLCAVLAGARSFAAIGEWAPRARAGRHRLRRQGPDTG